MTVPRESRQQLEPPNGGFGWFVVFGAQLINVFNQSLISIFGLLFGGYFTLLKETESRIALVMNLSSAFLNLTGLVTGPLLRNFTARSIAMFGCLLVSIGLMLSSITSSYFQIILTYSFMVGTGLGLIGPAIFLAISSYFTTKKSRAFGFAMAGTGFGQMILPIVVKFLLTEFGFRNAILVMGCLSLNGVLGASFFQPVEKHLIRSGGDQEQVGEMEPLLKPSPSTAPPSSTSAYESLEGPEGFWNKLAISLDLSLLIDIRFLILNFGLACAYAVSIDFALVLPFFLQDAPQLDKSQTAVCMSVLAASDLCSRLTFHFLTERFNMSQRSVFMIGILAGGIMRSILAELTNFTALVVTCAFFGYFRALTVVTLVLSISEFCTMWCPEKLPGALGLNMIMKGIAVVTLGQLMGLFRDYTHSYTLSLHLENIVLSVVMIVWVIELKWYKRD